MFATRPCALRVPPGAEAREAVHDPAQGAPAARRNAAADRATGAIKIRADDGEVDARVIALESLAATRSAARCGVHSRGSDQTAARTRNRARGCSARDRLEWPRRSRRASRRRGGAGRLRPRRAIRDGELQARISSIDPAPRAEIAALCDDAIRVPLEDIELDAFDSLDAGDVVFVDGSHRVFTNSDATVIILDVLPRLRPGVIVQVHDIFLPNDYPPEWSDRFDSEQYLLACRLLAESPRIEVLLPNAFASDAPILAPLWADLRMARVEAHGCSFWLRIRG